MEVNLITQYVWDKGLKGTGMKRLMEKLYEECDLPTSAVGRRDKLDVS